MVLLTMDTCAGDGLTHNGHVKGGWPHSQWTRVREMVSLTMDTCEGDGLTHNGHV